jgi:DNA repair photolyase
VRDVELFADLARIASAEVFFSITTVDLGLWRSLEPGTANPFNRLKAMRTLRQAGVPAGVMMAPILPGLTDSAASIEAVAAAARDHGAAHFSTAALRLAPHVKEFYLGFIGDEYPDLLGRYRRAYPGTYAPSEYRDKLNARVERIRAAYGFLDHGDRRRTAHPPTTPRRGPQLALPI